VLTGIEVTWPAGAAVEAWPARIPDLYLGEPVVVTARLEGDGARGPARRPARERRLVEQHGLSGGRHGDGVAVLWARRKIESLTDSLHEGANGDDGPPASRGARARAPPRHEVHEPGGVDVTPTRPEDEALKTAAVPTNLPHGWTYEGVGQLPQTATPAPLHTLVALLSLLAAAALLRADRAWRAGDRS
jgi:Ca-activated chloride channel family protein